MTPPALIDELDEILPGFKRYVTSDDNSFQPNTFHGVFAACTDFARGREVEADSWKNMAQLLNKAVGGSDKDLDNAACTCFIENLAAPEHPLRGLLLGEALQYWLYWE